MSIIHISKTETSENLIINAPELGDSRALGSVHRGHGGWLLVTAAAPGDHAAILVNGAAGCG